MEPTAALLKIWTRELVVAKVFNWGLWALMLVSAAYGIYQLVEEGSATFVYVALLFLVAAIIGGNEERRLERRLGASPEPDEV